MVEADQEILVLFSSLHDQRAFDHVHPAGEREFALARRELDRDRLVERKLAVDVVFLDHDLLRASLVGLSHEGHFGRRAYFEFEAGRLEAFISNLDGRGLCAIPLNRPGGLRALLT